MLLAHDFKHELVGRQVVTELHIVEKEARIPDGISENETLQEQQRRLKAELWQRIFGDVAKELRIAKDVARSCVDLHKCEIVNRAFATVERMLENPFIG